MEDIKTFNKEIDAYIREKRNPRRNWRKILGTIMSWANYFKKKPEEILEVQISADMIKLIEAREKELQFKEQSIEPAQIRPVPIEPAPIDEGRLKNALSELDKLHAQNSEKILQAKESEKSNTPLEPDIIKNLIENNGPPTSFFKSLKEKILGMGIFSIFRRKAKTTDEDAKDLLEVGDKLMEYAPEPKNEELPAMKEIRHLRIKLGEDKDG